MPTILPDLNHEEFSRRLRESVGRDLARDALERLWIHYRELRRWSVKLSLIGPGTAADAVNRHYAESLAALPLLGGASRLLDVGSGAGFPGLILAAIRTDLDVWLVESRTRKATFLKTVSRKASLECTVLDARVGASLPDGFPREVDLVSIRAVRLGAQAWSTVASRLSGDGRVLRWVGRSAVPIPREFEVKRRVEIAGSSRAIEELRRRRTTAVLQSAQLP